MNIIATQCTDDIYHIVKIKRELRFLLFYVISVHMINSPNHTTDLRKDLKISIDGTNEHFWQFFLLILKTA